jgi:hypothetical protein
MGIKAKIKKDTNKYKPLDAALEQCGEECTAVYEDVIGIWKTYGGS